MLYLFRIIRNNLFTIAFLVLFFFSFSQVLQYNDYHQTYYFNSSKSFFNSWDRLQNNVTSYFGLKDKNEALAKENIELRKSLASNYLIVDKTVRYSGDSLSNKRYSYILAKVIKSTVYDQNNFITIDKGRSSGIVKDMSVISPNGIAGVVYDVSDNFAIIISVLNTHFIASPYIPDINYRAGSVQWDGKSADIVKIKGISKFEKLKTGMEVFTSNYSTLFPEGIKIGKVKSFKPSGTDNFMDVSVELSNDFRKMDYVYVIKDFYKAEIDSLKTTEVRNGN